MEEVKALDLVRIGRECIAALNEDDWEKLRTFVAPDGKYYESGTHWVTEGLADMQEVWEGWKTAFPDLTGEVTNIFATDQLVNIEVLWKATHSGTLVTPVGEVTATFAPCTWRSVMVLEFDGKLINVNRHYLDLLSIFRQLGIHVLAGGVGAI
jgi:predicted ester cyclase